APQESWVPIGTFGIPLSNNDVISGQLNTLAVHPRNANVLYVGASEGGLWKSIDGGGSWSPMTDTQVIRTVAGSQRRGTLSIGSIAVNRDNPDSIYIGTGDPNQAEGVVGAALGVFRSG